MTMTVCSDIIGKLQADRPIYIFGAATVGRFCYDILKSANIPVKAFCDNNSSKFGTMIDGLEIVDPSAIKAIDPNAQFIITVSDINDVVQQLRGDGFQDWIAGGPLLKGHEVTEPYGRTVEFAKYAAETCIRCHDGYLDTSKVVLRSVEVIVTEKCTLKCKDCSNLMQYYQRPNDCDMDELIQQLADLFRGCDEVNEVRIIGGEPFINKQLDKLLHFLTSQDVVKNFVIYTNGTIVPREPIMEALKTEKALVIITDYGDLSRRREPLREALTAAHVRFVCDPATDWTDCGSIDRHDRSDQAAKKLFSECCARNLLTISNGKLYRCPFSAHLDRLDAADDLSGDSLDVTVGEVGALRQSIRSFAYDLETLKSCDYCKGRRLADPKIKPGVQTKEVLPYERKRVS